MVFSFRRLPHGGRGTALAVDRVLSLTAYLRYTHCLFRPTGFHAASTLSGSLRSPPSPRGEGFVHRYCFSTHACIRSVDMGIAVLSYRSLPHGGRLGIWERGRTNKKGEPKWFAFFACPTSLRQRGRWSLPCEGPKAGGTGAMRLRFLQHTVHQPWLIL